MIYVLRAKIAFHVRVVLQRPRKAGQTVGPPSPNDTRFPRSARQVRCRAIGHVARQFPRKQFCHHAKQILHSSDIPPQRTISWTRCVPCVAVEEESKHGRFTYSLTRLLGAGRQQLRHDIQFRIHFRDFLRPAPLRKAVTYRQARSIKAITQLVVILGNQPASAVAQLVQLNFMQITELFRLL